MEPDTLAENAAAEIAKVFLMHENLARLIATSRDPGLPDQCGRALGALYRGIVLGMTDAAAQSPVAEELFEHSMRE